MRARLLFSRALTDMLPLQQKTKLIEHYEKTLDAIHFGGHLMIINTIAANKLIDKYFKNI